MGRGAPPRTVVLERRPERARLLTRHETSVAAAPAARPADPRWRGLGELDHARPDRRAAPIRLVVGVGPGPPMLAGVRIRGVRAVGDVDERPFAAMLDRGPGAGLRPAVLGGHRAARRAAAPELELHDLPVALVATRPHDAAVLRVVGVEEPVLQPGAARGAA